MDSVTRRNLLSLSSAIEIGTGVVLILAPGLLCRLLLGVEVSGDATLLARFFGIALLCLGLACWPGGDTIAAQSAPARAMLLYNALIALFLTYASFGGAGGILLWPAVVLHAVIATLLFIGSSASKAV